MYGEGGQFLQAHLTILILRVHLVAPHIKSLFICSLCTSQGEAQDSPSVWVSCVEARSVDRDIIRQCLCSEQKGILWIACVVALGSKV